MNKDRNQQEAANGPGSDTLKSALIAKYKTSFVEKLSRKDLEELQVLLRNKFGEERTINPEYLTKFMFRLRDYFHEETLTREMASIEALVESLNPEDLPGER
jgi:hypothetical protein